jgi:hypothetical protein
MQLRNVRFVEPVIQIASNWEVSKSVVACHPGIATITAMRCSLEFDAWYFVKCWQDGLTNPHALRPLQRCVALSSLIFVFCKILARWAYKPTRIETITAMRCYIGCDALYFVKYWQDGLTKLPLIPLQRCVALSSLMLVFCKILARWAYKVAIETITAMHCSLEFDACIL